MRVIAGIGTVNEGGRERLKLIFKRLSRSSPIGRNPYLDYICSPILERIRFRAGAVR